MRAVAVVLVVLFHLRVPGFEAGYLGVDVFFVLSGFLITSLLIAEMQKHGGVSLLAFWSRRIRRLLPALALLLVVVALVTRLTATFTEMTSMRGDLLASTAYLANWRFIATSSYFANTGIESPLQHTWSLAIEEQFYVLWPLALAGLMAVVHRARLIVAALGVVGVVGSAIAMAWLYAPDAVERAYMGTDARIFEPLVGALGAVLVVTPQFREWLERHARAVLWAGVLVVLAGLVVIRPGEALYYYGGALAFSVATLLIVMPLWVGQGAVGRALSWGPVAWIGVVSYGIYLWHWPVILWLGVRDATGTRSVMLGVTAVVLTVAAAALSYYLVERPIRTGRQLGSHAGRRWNLRRPGVVLAAMPVVLLLVASFSVAATRVPPPPPGTPVLMTVGDSVPERLAVALEEASAAHGWRLVPGAFGGCSVTGETSTDANGVTMHESNQCPEVIVPAQDEMIREADPDVVLWWDRWVTYGFLDADGEHVATGTDRFWQLRRAGLEAAVPRLASGGATVVLVGVEPPGAAICTSREDRCPDVLRFRFEHFDDITERWNAMMRRYAAQHPDIAAYIDVAHVVCHDHASPCDDRIDGVPARPDGTHYEGPGEDLITTLLTDEVAPWMTPDQSSSPSP